MIFCLGPRSATITRNWMRTGLIVGAMALNAGMVNAFGAEDDVDTMYDLWNCVVTTKVEDWVAVADAEIGPVPNEAK